MSREWATGVPGVLAGVLGAHAFQSSFQVCRQSSSLSHCILGLFVSEAFPMLQHLESNLTNRLCH